MANDFQAQLRDEVKKKLAQLIDDGMDPAQVRAMVPQLQAKVAERYQAYETEQATKRSKLEASNQRLGAKIQQIEGESVSDQRLPGADPAKAEALRKAFRMPNELSDEELAAAPYDVFVAQERNQRAFRNAPTQEKVAMQTEAMVGNLLGAGAGKAVGKAVSGVTKPLISKGVELVGNALGGGASAGAGRAAGNVVSDEREWHEGVGDSMQTGAILGGAATAGGQGGAAAARKLRSDPAMGTRLAARERGAYPSRLEPESARTPEARDMAQLPGGMEGKQKAAEMATGRVTRRSAEMDAEAARKYHEAVDPRSSEPVDASRIKGTLRSRQVDNLDPDTGLPVNDRVNAQLEDAVGKTGDTATVGGTLKRRRAMKRDAAFDSPDPTPEQRAAQDVYMAFREGVRRASPEVAAADDAYTDHARQSSRRNDILWNTEDTVVGGGKELGEPGRLIDAADDIGTQATPELRVGKEKQATALLGRAGATDTPGLRVAKYLDELAAMDPEFAKSVEFVKAKRALEDTKFSLFPQDNPNLSVATYLGGLPRLAIQNARAMGVHFADPLAQAMANQPLSGAHVGGALANPLEEATDPVRRAAMEERRRNAERARKAREAYGRK